MTTKMAWGFCALFLLWATGFGLYVERAGFLRGEQCGFQEGEHSVSRQVITSFQPCGKWNDRISEIMRCAGIVFKVSDNRNGSSTVYSYSLGVQEHGKQYPR